MADLDIARPGTREGVPLPVKRDGPPPAVGDEYLGITTDKDRIAFGHDDIAKHVAAWAPENAQRHLFLALASLALMECDDELEPVSRIYPHIPMEHGKVIDLAAVRLREGREVAISIHERLVAIKVRFGQAAEAMEKNSARLHGEVAK